MVDSCVKQDWSIGCRQIAYASSVNQMRLVRTFEAFNLRERNNIVNFGNRRSAYRHSFNEPIIIALSPGKYEGFEHTVQLAMNGWTINLSKSGLGIVCGRTIYSVNRIDDGISQIPTDRIIQPGSELRIVFLRDGYEVKGLLSEVVRLRNACEELLDMGVQFHERNNNSQCQSVSLQPLVKLLQPYAVLDICK